MAGCAVLRWARALTLASVMLAGALSGHVAAGGIAPPVALMGPMLVVVTVGVSPFLDAPASARRIVALVLAGQGVLHMALSVLGSTGVTHAAPMTMPSSTGHEMAHVMPGGSSSSLATSSMTGLSGAHLDMLVAHLGAALMVALWLAAGERAAWILIGVTTLAVEAWLIVVGARCVAALAVVPMRPRPVSAWGARRRALRSVWVGRGGLSRRGPPRVCVA